MNIEARIAEIRDRLKEIRGLVESDAEANIDELETEARALNEERDGLERRQTIVNKMNDGAITPNPSNIPNPLTARAAAPDADALYRSAWLKSLMGKPRTEAEERSLAVANVSGAVPTQTAAEIIKKLKQLVPLLDEVTLLHVPGNVKFAVEGTQTDAALHTENEAIDPDDDTLVSVTLAGYEIVKVMRISASVRAMTINSFEAWLVDMLTERLAGKIEDYIVNGTGTSQPGGLESITWATTNKHEWAVGASLAASDMSAGIALLPGGYDRNAKFLMNKKTLWVNVMPIRDDAKAPIVKDDGRGNYIIYGYPVMLSDKAAQGVIYLGDFKKIVANLAEDMTVMASEHSGFTANAIDYRGACIFDCKPALEEAFVKIVQATESA